MTEQDRTALVEQLRTQTCNLSVLRRIVDGAISKWQSKGLVPPIPNGYAGEIAADLWTHLQTALVAALQGDPPAASPALSSPAPAHKREYKYPLRHEWMTCPYCSKWGPCAEHKSPTGEQGPA